MNQARVAIFGASGRTGRALARVAMGRGVPFRALVRESSEVPPELDRAEKLVRGDLFDVSAVGDVVDEASGVCCVFGPRLPTRDVFCERATQCVIEVMRQAGVRRLVCQTGAMVGGDGHLSVPLRWMARRFARSRPAVARDRGAQEAVVRASGLEWTLVKPPRLRDGRPAGGIRAGTDMRVGLLSSVDRSDLAVFLMDALTGRDHLQEAVYVISATPPGSPGALDSRHETGEVI